MSRGLRARRPAVIVRKREALADEAGNKGPSGAGESETTARAPVEYRDRG